MLFIAFVFFAVLATGFGFSSYQAAAFEKNNPNQGELIDVGGYRMNSVYVPRPKTADLPTLVFIHGASANLRDLMTAFRAKLDGRADMLFVDRPGLGFSERGGPQNAFPDGQADAIAALMKKRGIRKAIIVSHSFGGAIAATFALNHKDMVEGLVFLSPATHPWPGGIEWYYSAARTPVLGWLFSTLIAPPAGLAAIDKATKSVFAPNPRPDDYIENTAAYLALRPRAFRNNAIDVANLLEYVKRVSPRYREIKAPTVIITGDADNVVYPHIHSRQLHAAIAGSTLLTIHNLGHKPDYIVTDLAISAIESVAGKKRNLKKLAAEAEARITVVQ
ncbi:MULTISPECIES: alpha/beta fold hydrolase [unclassified Rhizobium]|uniref:alpha/beta fold hydrolase n=1 Tax=unclassified Rhizobium TaxID=2613769 RepID=UPI000715F262|nr:MULTISPECIES: alpha/beta hydrolase [unclassified Rhizobium]KQS89775.1 esterase [Rhizobium sp. Leaf391]KQS95055.1 esterase [Rhizobium sp. Leaf386]KQU01731.1 esterase [Rhizobium sp. Leaf453]